MKKIFAILLLIGVMCSLVSCGEKLYNVRYAEDYTFKEGWGSAYGVSNYDSITKVIYSESELDEVFQKFTDIDFEKEIIVYYSYVTTHSRKVKIDKVYLDGDVLIIELKKIQPISIFPVYDATAPQRKCLVFRLDKGGYKDIKIKWA